MATRIENQTDYEAYKKEVDEFFKREGIENLSTEGEPSFSSWSCDCCGGHLAGDRYNASGYNRKENEVYEYTICQDCMYYAEYGQLDDMTMLDKDLS